MNRCEECGSWDAECGNADAVDGCGCARCLSAKVLELTELSAAQDKAHAELFRKYDMLLQERAANCWPAKAAYHNIAVTQREKCAASLAAHDRLTVEQAVNVCLKASLVTDAPTHDPACEWHKDWHACSCGVLEKSS